MALRAAGMQGLALRFEDIVAQPQRVLSAVFAYCGLEEASVEDAYGVFAKDSQEGTYWSRESRKERPAYPLEDEDYAQIRAVLREHPVVQSPDFVVPGTLTLSEV